MKPTILEGDRIFVNKLAYDLKIPFTTWHLAEWNNPQRGDIVVFFSPHDVQRLVKRVCHRGDRLVPSVADGFQHCPDIRFEESAVDEPAERGVSWLGDHYQPDARVGLVR